MAAAKFVLLQLFFVGMVRENPIAALLPQTLF